VVSTQHPGLGSPQAGFPSGCSWSHPDFLDSSSSLPLLLNFGSPPSCLWLYLSPDLCFYLFSLSHILLTSGLSTESPQAGSILGIHDAQHDCSQPFQHFTVIICVETCCPHLLLNSRRSGWPHIQLCLPTVVHSTGYKAAVPSPTFILIC
jgi:hypothetical protein